MVVSWALIRPPLVLPHTFAHFQAGLDVYTGYAHNEAQEVSPVKRAYSIVRFSSWKQAKGESTRRQLEWSSVWAERHGYLLDDSLHQDRPVSAFRGANRSK